MSKNISAQIYKREITEMKIDVEKLKKKSGKEWKRVKERS